jgi:AcrR family transcriptional regulator
MRETLSSPRRAYRQQRRGEQVNRTKERITDAAVRLHTTVGPSETSMSAVADAAGVTRLTLYRHFPSKDELFRACMTHWRSLHPPPDADRWRAIASFDARLRIALDELYAWYGENGRDLFPIYRDADDTPESNQRARRESNARMAEAILADLETTPARRRRVRAALGHVIGFWTWHSLVIEQGLTAREASAMAAAFVLSALEGTARP